MPYTPGNFSHQHILMQWGGKLPGNEQWSCSIRLAEQTTTGLFTQVPPQLEVSTWLAGSMKDAVSDYHQRAGTAINPSAKLSFVKANRIGVDGRYMDAVTNEYIFADLPGGGNNTNPPPNQNTIAVSLTTGYSRGLAHRGRFFLPLPAVVIDAATGEINNAYVDSIRASTKTFLEAIADVPGLDAPNSVTPVVMSRKAGGGTYRVVTGVEVGRIMDTQRRRRKSMKERYLAQDLDLGVN